MIITDNSIPIADLQKIQSVLLGNDFPWYFFPYKVGKSYGEFSGSDYDFQFQHIFYNNYSAQSRYIDLLQPLIDLLNASALVRIKANLTARTENIITFPMHRDFENFDGETAIFYVNTNNGKTEFESGSSIESVENRLVKFSSDKLHTGTTCTDQKIRCVINFNYYKWKN